MTFEIKHDNGSVIDSITASIDSLWTEKQFTDRHGKESIAAKGTFQLWRDDVDPRMIVLSMINKIPDGDVASKCFRFFVQVHAAQSAQPAALQPVYYNATTQEQVKETRFAMASKTPDEIASKAQRVGRSDSSAAKAASSKASSRVRANHKGAATKAKKPRSVPLESTAATRTTARSSSVAAARGKAKVVDPSKAKVVAVASGGKPRKVRSSKTSRPKTAKTKAPRRESKVAPVRSASPIDLNPFATAAAAVEQPSVAAPQQTQVEQSTLDLESNATAGWGSCPAPVLNEDDDDDMVIGGLDDSTLQHVKEEVGVGGHDDEDEMEMVTHTAGGSASERTLFSPVFSDGSFSRPSSSRSTSQQSSAPADYAGVDSTPAPFLPQPHYEQQVQINLPSPSLAPPLAFGTVPHDARPLPQPAAQAQGGYAYSYSMPTPMTTPAPGHAASMLAANTPMVDAIQDEEAAAAGRRRSLEEAAAAPDRPPTPPPPQPAALDMDLTNNDSCSSWCDGPEPMAGAISMDDGDSPQFSAMLNGMPPTNLGSPAGSSRPFGGMFSSPVHSSAFASAPVGGVVTVATGHM